MSKKLSCQTFRMESPWKVGSTCHIYDGKWIPVPVLATMAGIHYNRGLSLCREFMERTSKCGNFAHVVRITNLHLAIRAMKPEWDADTVVESIDQIETRVALGSPGIPDEVVPQPKKRKFVQPEEKHEWFVDFLDRYEREAIEEFKHSEKFKRLCILMAQKRVDAIQDQLYARAEEGFKSKQSETRKLQSFILPGTKT